MPEVSSTPNCVIALVRHGDYHQPKGVPSALLPYGLNSEGIHQAKAAGVELKAYAQANGLMVDSQLHSSLQQRAWQTASLIAKELGADYQMVETSALSERSVGAMANLTVDQIEQILLDDPRYPAAPPGWKSDSHYCLPFQGAESLLQAGQRVAAHIVDTREVMNQQIVKPTLKIIVGHGASIRHACAALNILELEVVKSISMYHARPVYIAKIDGNWQVIAGEWKPRSKQSDGDEIRER